MPSAVAGVYGNSTGGTAPVMTDATSLANSTVARPAQQYYGPRGEDGHLQVPKSAPAKYDPALLAAEATAAPKSPAPTPEQQENRSTAALAAAATAALAAGVPPPLCTENEADRLLPADEAHARMLAAEDEEITRLLAAEEAARRIPAEEPVRQEDIETVLGSELQPGTYSDVAVIGDVQYQDHKNGGDVQYTAAGMMPTHSDYTPREGVTFFTAIGGTSPSKGNRRRKRPRQGHTGRAARGDYQNYAPSGSSYSSPPPTRVAMASEDGTAEGTTAEDTTPLKNDGEGDTPKE